MAASTSEALARRRATYRDVRDAPAHPIAEVIDGMLYIHLTAAEVAIVAEAPDHPKARRCPSTSPSQRPAGSDTGVSRPARARRDRARATP